MLRNITQLNDRVKNDLKSEPGFFGKRLKNPELYFRQMPEGRISGSQVELRTGLRLHELFLTPAAGQKLALELCPARTWMGFVRRGSATLLLPDLGRKTLSAGTWFIGRFENITVVPDSEHPIEIVTFSAGGHLMQKLIPLAEPGVAQKLACFTCTNQFRPTTFIGASSEQFLALTDKIHICHAHSLTGRLELEEAALEWLSGLFRQRQLTKSGKTGFGCSLIDLPVENKKQQRT